MGTPSGSGSSREATSLSDDEERDRRADELRTVASDVVWAAGLLRTVHQGGGAPPDRRDPEPRTTRSDLVVEPPLGSAPTRTGGLVDPALAGPVPRREHGVPPVVAVALGAVGAGRPHDRVTLVRMISGTRRRRSQGESRQGHSHHHRCDHSSKTSLKSSSPQLSNDERTYCCLTMRPCLALVCADGHSAALIARYRACGGP